MSKKTLTIAISAILTIFFVGLVGYYLLNRNNETGTGGIVNTFVNFLPFGGSSNNENPENIPPENNGGNNTEEPQTFLQKLRKISSEPVSGAGTLDLKAGTIVRYIEKATGHIFEVELFSPKQQRISNTTIPLSYDAIWGNKNTSFVARYLKDDNETIDTYSITLKSNSTTTENALSGVAFPDRISDVSVFGTNIFYLQQNTDNSSGFVSTFDGTKKREVWNSPIKELSSQFINDRTVVLSTKPLEDVAGYLYSVDTTTGVVRKILGNISGLTSLPNSDLSKVIYLEQSENAILHIINTKTGTKLQVGFVTFPEKCVWSKKNKDIVYCAIPKGFILRNSLSSWYKGLVSFSDDIWKIDSKNGETTKVIDIENESKESVDAIKPIISDNEQYIVFINKKDNSLWSLDLTK